MKKLLFSLLLALFITNSSIAQLAINNLALLPGLKTGKTYVAVPNPKDLTSPFVEVLKKTWTITTLEFVSYDDIRGHYLEPNASFLTVNFSKLPAGSAKTGSPNQNSNVSLGYLSLDFWTCEQGPKVEKRLSKAKDILLGDVKKIATYPIYAMPITTLGFIMPGDQFYCEPVHLFTPKYDNIAIFTYYTKIWGPGVYKNMLQEIDRKITEGEEFNLHRGGFSTGEISALKTDTLFIPITVMSRKLAAELPTEKEQKSILEKYTYAYKVITEDDLNKMILGRTKPFYYLKYHRDEKYYFVSIINSENGKTVYFESRVKFNGQYNFEASDMTAIANIIKNS